MSTKIKKKYNIHVEAKVYAPASVEVQVMASSNQEAIDIAENMAITAPGELAWKLEEPFRTNTYTVDAVIIPQRGFSKVTKEVQNA